MKEPQPVTCIWHPSGACSLCGRAMGRAENGIRACTDRTAYIPGTMTLAREWTPAPPKGSPLEAWKAWLEHNCPDGEFNDTLAQLHFEESSK